MIQELIFKLNRIYYKRILKSLGKNFIADGICIKGGSNISIGDNVSITKGCILWVGVGTIHIGDYVMIGYHSILIASNHKFEYSGVEIALQGYSIGHIVIGRDVWIGSNVTILPDVHIGDGAVIGAGSVVTCDVLPYSVVAGVPARCIQKRV